MSEASNAKGLAEIDRFLGKLRRLDRLPQEIAPELGRELEAQIKRQIAAGKGPDGKPWPRTKDGKQPLRTAGKALSVAVQGTIVILKLTGHIARHHLGAVRGGVRRQILPSDKIPEQLARSLREIAIKGFKRIL